MESTKRPDLSPGARRAFQAAERRAEVAEAKACDAEARARAAEAMVEQLQAGFARVDRLAETMTAFAGRLDRLERGGAPKVLEQAAWPVSGGSTKQADILRGYAEIGAYIRTPKNQVKHLTLRGVLPVLPTSI